MSPTRECGIDGLMDCMIGEHDWPMCLADCVFAHIDDALVRRYGRRQYLDNALAKAFLLLHHPRSRKTFRRADFALLCK